MKTIAHHLRSEGSVLVAVLVSAVICSLVAYGMLTLALSNRWRTKAMTQDRARAQYAAEAVTVWANERLFMDPTYCGSPAPNASDLATDFPGLSVALSVTGGNCSGLPSGDKRVQVTVGY